jgi:hypothetical protein
MTDVVRGFTLNIPGGGSVSNIFFVDCELGISNVTKILLSFPPGCAGLVGIRVEHGGNQLYPQDPGTFFIFDDYPLEIPVTNQGNAGQWHVAGYNTDFYPHLIQAYFYYDYVDIGSAQSASLPVSL